MPIGVASAFGNFMVNSARVTGSADISDGAQIKTDKTASQVFLQNGVTVNLADNSAATVYGNRVILQRGAARIDRLDSVNVQASRFHVQGNESHAQGIVRVTSKAVEVASLNGTLNVTDEKGVLLSRVDAGTAAAFAQDAQQDQSDNNSEVMKKRKGGYNTDSDGSHPIPNGGGEATSGAGGAQAGSGAGAGTAASTGASTGAGIGLATTGAIIGGVAGAAGLVAAFTAGATSGSTPSTSP